MLFAPIRWLDLPTALPGVDPAAPEYQRAIVEVIAAQIAEDPSGDVPGVGVGDTGWAPGGDAAAQGAATSDGAGAGAPDAGGPFGASPSPDDPDGGDEDGGSSPEPPPDGAPEAGDAGDAAAGRGADEAPDPSAVFVSWVLAEAGVPVCDDAGPAGAGAEWAPGTVAELVDALRARGAFTDDPGYMPSVGDDARIVAGAFDRDITTADFDGDGVSVTTMGLRGRTGVLGFGMTGELDLRRGGA